MRSVTFGLALLQKGKHADHPGQRPTATTTTGTNSSGIPLATTLPSVYLRTKTCCTLHCGGGNVCLQCLILNQLPNQRSRWSSHADSHNAGSDMEWLICTYGGEANSLINTVLAFLNFLEWNFCWMRLRRSYFVIWHVLWCWINQYIQCKPKCVSYAKRHVFFCYNHYYNRLL